MTSDQVRRFAYVFFTAVFASANAGTIDSPTAPVPFEHLGKSAQERYSGDGIEIRPEKDGASLRVIFQKLEATATDTGLWLDSTEDDIEPGSFRVIADSIGRESVESDLSLSAKGRVVVSEESVHFVRSGLVEEYQVSMDGVRQDFVVLERPAGKGRLRLELDVAGAEAGVAADGVSLTLRCGRQIAYNRLHVTDARGRVLPARMAAAAGDRIRIFVDDAEADYPVRVDPTFSDADWVGMGGLAGSNDLVRAMVIDDDSNLYIGGLFTAVGETVANRVAKWDGSQWSSLGSGLSGGVGQVYALAWSDGNLFAAGSFTTAGGTPASNIAMWNGSEWGALGAGTGGAVNAIALAGSDLYVGGAFTTAGGGSASRIAKWNGSTWSALGDGLGSTVNALAVVGSDIFAGGMFTTAGGQPANRIAKWDGTNWTPLGQGVDGLVNALVSSGGDLFVGGSFTAAGGASANRIAKWDGTSWTPLDQGVNGDVGISVRGMAISGADLFVGGSFTSAGGQPAINVAKWNGTSWSSMGSGANNSVFALAVENGDCYVGGGFSAAGGVQASGLAVFDGSGWSPLATRTGLNGNVSALADAGNLLYAGGAFTSAGNQALNRIAKWNGTSWEVLGDGLNGSVNAVAASGTRLYAGGNFSVAGDQPASNIATWDDANWAALGDGVNGPVHAIAIAGDDLYVGGDFTTAGGSSAGRIAKWDGTSWSALGSGLSGPVAALAILNGHLFVGGTFTAAGGQPASNIAVWDGGSWNTLGSGVNGPVHALTRDGVDLYVGGAFDAAGGGSANNIARWNGTSWSALGQGTGAYVRSISAVGGNVYVGGSFTTAGGQPASFISKWNGSSWNALGSGANYPVLALAVSGGDLYAGGFFTTAGDKVSTHLARTPLFEITLSGNGSEIGIGDSSPSPVDHTDFGETSDFVERTFTVGNNGTANLELTDAPTAVAVEGASAFVVTQQPAPSIAPDGNTTFTVTFAPESPGQHSATVSIASNDTDRAPFTFAISGFATLPQINISGNGVPIPDGADTTSLADHTDFGPVSSLGGSVGRTFTIENDGTADLVLADAPTAVALSGSSAFTVSQQASSPVAPDGETSFTVTFAPETPGPHSATVSIASNDPAKTPYTFSISGTATVPRIEVTGNDATIPTGSSEPSLANHTQFGNVSTIGAGLTRTFAIANSGDENLALTNAPNSVVLAGSDAFTVTQQPGSPISPDGDETFSITFAPATTGPHSATVSIASNDPEKSPYTFAIAGTGIKPTLSILGNGSPVAHGSGNPPSGTHPHFGPAPFPGGSVERTFTLHNTGGAALNFTGGPDPVVIEGSSAFIVSVQPGSSIDPGGEATITIRFLPNAPGLHSATVSITSDDPETGIYTFTVEGIGTQPLISIWDGAKSLANDIDIVRFPTSSLRKRSKPKSLSIRNEGSSDLIDLRVSIAGRQRRDFLISGPSQMVLAPTEVALIKVIFRPIGKGARKATLEIGSNAANGPIFRIQTKGRGR